MIIEIKTLKFISTLAIIKSRKMWAEELKHVEFDKNFGRVDQFKDAANLWKHNRNQELFGQELHKIMKTMMITESDIIYTINDYDNKEVVAICEQYNDGLITFMELYNKFMCELIK
jgi:adenylate cyclase class IV